MLAAVDFLIVSALLFSIGVLGIIINRKNVIVLLMSLELILLAVNTNFITYARFLNDTAGEIFVFFILTVAAAEAAIGLAILVVLYRSRKSINVDDLNLLQG